MSAYLIAELMDSRKLVYGVCYVKLNTKRWVTCDQLSGLNPLVEIEQALTTLHTVAKDDKSIVLVLTRASTSCIKERMRNSGLPIDPYSASGLPTRYKGISVVELTTECKWSDYAKAHYTGLRNIFQIIR